MTDFQAVMHLFKMGLFVFLDLWSEVKVSRCRSALFSFCVSRSCVHSNSPHLIGTLAALNVAKTARHNEILGGTAMGNPAVQGIPSKTVFTFRLWTSS